MKKAKTLTAVYVTEAKKVEYPHNRKQEDYIEIKNVNINNIKKIFGIDSLYFFFETNENYDDLDICDETTWSIII